MGQGKRMVRTLYPMRALIGSPLRRCRISAAPAAVAGVLLALGACTSPAAPPAAARPSAQDTSVLRVTAVSTVDSLGDPSEAAVMALPDLGEPPQPPAGVRSCGDVSAWLRGQGAVDLGGSQVLVNVWAPDRDVTVVATRVEVVVLERREAFETRAIACSADASVPDLGQLPLEEVPGERPSTAGDARMLDGMTVGEPVRVPAHYVHMFWTTPRPLDLRAGDRRPYIAVRTAAVNGWYDWEVVVHLLVDGKTQVHRLRDQRDGKPFSTNSGYIAAGHNQRPRTESYVWCVHDQPPQLRRQAAPFLCPDEKP